MSETLDRARILHEGIRSLLLAWDPIGVAGATSAQDEYDGYVPTLYKTLIRKVPVHEIFEYLWWLETVHMGLLGDRQRTLDFSHRLMRLPEEL